MNMLQEIEYIHYIRYDVKLLFTIASYDAHMHVTNSLFLYRHDLSQPEGGKRMIYLLVCII